MLVVDVLPIIRKELSVELVNIHGMTMAKVAKIFKVSGTAVSQYIHGIRGDSAVVENSPHYEGFMEEISLSADRLAKGESEIMRELCRICDYVERVGILSYVHEKSNGTIPLVECAECPRENSEV
ncbi:MAG: transcriptional regulator [Methanomassiliicoccaceae archaeon]|nr:transcriptional regulator [Methanomassiliicoccaceae archaeon]